MEPRGRWLLCAVSGAVGAGRPVGLRQASPPTDDIVTASDEPETRRRARIRLQLAVGYFEQGKTTVALDEVKQALNIDPYVADAYNLRGLIYMRLNDMRLAEESFRRGAGHQPE